MGLLSKLLQEGKKELAPVLDVLKEAAQKAGADTPQNAPAPDSSGNLWSRPAKSGFSWGERMPAEENQYSFNGSHIEYFDKVFSEEFPTCRITRETLNDGRRIAYSFWQGERKVAVAELMSERCGINRLRASCAAQGIPYVRFYFDHPGWWNTRSYVAQRSHAILGL